MWCQVALVLSAWPPAADWEAVDGSLDNIEKALQAVSSSLPDKVARIATGTMGWIFLIALKVNMDSAFLMLCSCVNHGDEKKSSCIHTLEQEMHGFDEPSALDYKVMRDDDEHYYQEELVSSEIIAKYLKNLTYCSY